MSLLDKALKVPTEHRRRLEISQEEIDLAVAWFSDKVTTKQVSAVIECSLQNVPTWCGATIRRAVRAGKLALTVHS